METGQVQYIFCTQIIESLSDQLECDTFFPPLDDKPYSNPVDITEKVALVIEPKISSDTYDSEHGYFVEAGVRYKMLMFVLKQKCVTNGIDLVSVRKQSQVSTQHNKLSLYSFA